MPDLSVHPALAAATTCRNLHRMVRDLRDRQHDDHLPDRGLTLAVNTLKHASAALDRNWELEKRAQEARDEEARDELDDATGQGRR